MPKRILEGRVVSDKGEKTVTVLVERRVRHPLYKKFVKKTKRYAAHDESNALTVGTKVQIEECRPLSKRKRFRVISGDPVAAPKSAPKPAKESEKAEEAPKEEKKETAKKAPAKKPAAKKAPAKKAEEKKPAAKKKAPAKKPAAKKTTKKKEDKAE